MRGDPPLQKGDLKTAQRSMGGLEKGASQRGETHPDTGQEVAMGRIEWHEKVDKTS